MKKKTPTAKQMKASDPCICGSKKIWKSCCGQQLRQKETFAVLVKMGAPVPVVRFFLGNMLSNLAFTDEENRVVVFTNRAQALACNERLACAYQVIGMSEEKWALFQKDVPDHVVITDAVA